MVDRGIRRRRARVVAGPPRRKRHGRSAGPLDEIAAGLNGLQVPTERTGWSAEERRAWQAAENIVTWLPLEGSHGAISQDPASALDSARREFNGAAHDDGVRAWLHVRWKPRPESERAALIPRRRPLVLEAVVQPVGARARVLHLLWENFFRNGEWRRLKRCRRCAMWFADHSDSRTRSFCSETCRDKWWDRGRRRQALVEPRPRHGRPRARRAPHRG
jgi:hypothetical protein